jgi:recombination protein RecA
MFGCMSWDTEVTLADGTKEYIGKIVDQRLPVDVLSYDTVAGDFVAKRVVNWFNNGATSDFLHVSVADSGSTGSSRSTLACTPNHLVATPSGWTPAGDLQAGDPVLRPVEHYLSEFQWDALLGMLMGDGLLSPTRNGLAARLRWRQADERAAYADWKASLFENLDVSRPIGSQGVGFFALQPLHELNELRRAVYLGGRKVLSFDYLKRLTALSIALWYQDVGSFNVSSKGLQDRTRGGSGRSEICVEAIERTSRERLRQHLADTWDLRARLVSRAGKAVLEFPAAQTVKLHALVAPFVHPSMDDKLLPRFRGQFKLRPEFEAMRTVAAPMPVVDITSRPATSRPDRFDIEVEGSHSYLAGGVVVHNSPETTPGGRALKFYSSVRLDVRRIETLKDGTAAVGNRVRVKVVKNKVAPPFRQAEFDIIYGEGISKEGSLIDVGVEEGIIRKAGAWYTYDGEQLGQGKENARSFLREHVDVAQEIEKRVKEKLGIDPLVADGNVVDEGL